MLWLGQQMVRMMQDCGWDAKIFECHRPPEKQREYLQAGTSNAKEWMSPHQYHLAVDIIHRVKAWDVPDRFWEDLAACARVLSEKHKIPLELGFDWGWDKAHIEYADFRLYRTTYFGRDLSQAELDQMFRDLLPHVWKQHEKSRSFRR